MKVGELAKRLDVPYRHLRYLLEEGFLPTGVDKTPGRGEHRELTPSQTFWLGFVLALKGFGIKTPRAAQIADLADRGVRGIARNLNWDHKFDPFRGAFETEFRWFIDVGDLQYIRIATTANPSKVDKLDESPWTEIGSKAPVKQAEPLVTLRIDMSKLAKKLSGVRGEP